MLEKSPSVNFIDGVHGLRAAAALAVVVFHSGGAIGAEKYQGISWIAQATSGLNSGVDLFFVISGFVIALPFFYGRKIRVSDFLVGRFLRIFPLSALTAIIFIGTAWVVFGRAPDADTILSSILLLPNGTDPVPIVLWTLKQELLFYTMFSLVFISPIFGFSALIVWGFASLTLSGSSPILDWLFNVHNVQFLFGVSAAFIFVRVAVRPGLALAIAIFASFAFLLISYGDSDYSERLSAVLLGFFGAGSVLGFALARVTVAPVIMFLGTASYSIYLIHYFFVSVGNKILITLTPSAPGAVALLILVAFSTSTGCLYYLVFERKLEMWRKKVALFAGSGRS